MRWKQFFTPVQSFDALEADDYMRQTNAAAYTLLDVRQPKEYEAEHLPGAKLVPLPDLGERLAELDAAKPQLLLRRFQQLDCPFGADMVGREIFHDLVLNGDQIAAEGKLIRLKRDTLGHRLERSPPRVA